MACLRSALAHPAYSYKIKIINPTRKSDVIVRDLNDCSMKFIFAIALRVNPLERVYQAPLTSVLDILNSLMVFTSTSPAVDMHAIAEMHSLHIKCLILGWNTPNTRAIFSQLLHLSNAVSSINMNISVEYTDTFKVKPLP